MKQRIWEALAAAGGFIASFFTGLPPIVWVLVTVMGLDYLTGVLCGLRGKSPKTANGGVSSQTAFNGLLKKAIIVIVVILSYVLDFLVSSGAGVQFSAVSGATCLWFIASEGISILENAAALGVKIPQVLLQALEIVKSKGGENKPPEA